MYAVTGSSRPDETPWEGGVFNLKFQFTEEYPHTAPKVQFTTKMFHPNSAPEQPLRLMVLGSLYRRIDLLRHLAEQMEPQLWNLRHPHVDSGAFAADVLNLCSRF